MSERFKREKMVLGGHKSACTKQMTSLSSLLESVTEESEVDYEQIQSIINVIRKKLEDVKDKHGLVLSLVTDDDEFGPLIETQTDYEQKAERIILSGEKIIKNNSRSQLSDTTLQSVGSGDGNRLIKLPQLKLLQFDGTVTGWSTFWDSFKAAVHDRGDLSDSQKFTYLKGQLHGDALTLIKALPTINKTYGSAVELLQQTYCNKLLQVLEHLTIFRGICVNTYTFESVRKFRAESENLISGMSAIGYDIVGNSTAEMLVIGLFLEQMHPVLKDNIIRMAGEKILTIAKFREAIATELSLLGSKATCNAKLENKREKFDKNKSRNTYIESEMKSSTSNFNISTKENKKRCCGFCNELHRSSECSKYAGVKERIARLKILKKCTKCMKPEHDGSTCGNLICYKCKNDHILPLCPEIAQNKNVISVNSNITAKKQINSVALPTVMLPVIKKAGEITELRALLDQGSQKSFILASTATKLELAIHGTESLTIKTFNGESKEKIYNIASIPIKDGPRRSYEIMAVLVDALPQQIKVPGIVQTVNILKHDGILLADPNIASGIISNFDLLVGADFYYDVLAPDKPILNHKGVNLIATKHGYAISGRIENKSKATSEITAGAITVMKVGVDTSPWGDAWLPDQDYEISKLWLLDLVGIKDESEDLVNDKVLKEFNDTIKYNGERYIVKLPWKENNYSLPTNYALAKGRLNGLLKKLRKSPNLLDCYHKVILDQLDRNFIEKVPDDQLLRHSSHYIPHQAVIREHPTTPCRVVFDCSAKTGRNAVSLNDCLYSGPSLVPELVKLLLRFRLNKYVVISDIAKAFLQVGLSQEDRDYTRFLWPQNPEDVDSPVNTYRFKVVLFGSTASPFLLQATIWYHMKTQEMELKYDTERLLRNIYVDNLHGGSDDEEDLIKFYRESLKCYATAGFPLREWVSNSPKLTTLIQEDKMQPKEEVNLVKLLGIMWDMSNDSFQTQKVKIPEETEVTKRMVVSQTAKLFDPLGILSPFSIKAKILIQRLWKDKIDWDAIIPESYLNPWNHILEEMGELHNIEIPRWIISDKNVTVHLFSDASSLAYCSCAYVIKNGDSHLLMAKARVAPVKKLTIPKLELTALNLSAKLASYLQTTFDAEFESVVFHLWADSKVCLYWINSDKENKNVFVRNRVRNIQEKVPKAQFHYVPSKENPADISTRGTETNKELIDLWLKGPPWLADFSKWPADCELDPDDVVNLTVSTQEGYSANEALPEATRYSRWAKLIRITSYVRRALRKKEDVPESINITVKEYKESEIIWIEETQNKHFFYEKEYLSTFKGKCPPLVKQLGLFLDGKLLKIKTRLTNADITETAKSPILLPRDDHISRLIILDYHEKTMHGSSPNVMALLKEKFWIPKTRQVIGKTLQSCMKCRMVKGVKYEIPPAPPLPDFRVKQVKPFEISGTDYSGPLLVRDKGTKIERKVYVALFTCANTRAVHLELAQDASAEAFAMVFRRFAARRSVPSLLISDNGTNFKGFLPQLEELQSHPSVAGTLLQHKTTWKFIPARAAWMGGFYERMIALTKNIIKRMLGRAMLTYDELHTIIIEVESRINDRPLTYVEGSYDDPSPLTPSLLLMGHRVLSLPSVTDFDETEPISICEDTSLNRRHRHILNLINKAWERWQTEYLIMLRDRDFKGNPSKGLVPKIGDVVIFKDDGLSKNMRLGKITELKTSGDGECRVAKIKMKGGFSIRPLSKLAFLESSSRTPGELSEEQECDQIDDISTEDGRRVLPKRRAADTAKTSISKFYSKDLV